MRRSIALHVAFALCFSVAAIQCAGQSFPGLQLIQPDPDSGRPSSVATPCAGPTEFGDQTWVAPILIYEDALTEMFIDQNCIVAAVQMGYSQDGKFMVAMYSHYKSSEYPCKYLLGKEGESNADYQRECKMIGYRVRWVDVDTRAKKMVVTRSVLLDIRGFHAASQKGNKDWSTFAELQKDPIARPMLTAIERTTKLVDKELEYWKYRYGQE